jgi:hypothetical protein
MNDFTEITMIISSVLLKVKGLFIFSLSFLAAYLLSLFLPVSVFIESLYLLIVADLLIGSWHAKINKESFDMEKALLTIKKFILYPVAVMLAGHFERTYSSGIPVTQVVAGTAAIFEMRSVYGHITGIVGMELWSVIMEVIKDRFPKVGNGKGKNPKKDT